MLANQFRHLKQYKSAAEDGPEAGHQDRNKLKSGYLPEKG